MAGAGPHRHGRGGLQRRRPGLPGNRRSRGRRALDEVGWDLVAGSRIPAEERAIFLQVRMLHGKARAAAARRDLTAADALVAQTRSAMDADAKNAEHYRWIYPYLKAYVEPHGATTTRRSPTSRRSRRARCAGPTCST